MSENQKHRIFISFYHSDDNKFKERLDDLFDGVYTNESVQDGEYDPDNSDEYVKSLIREEKITNASVVIVLIGPNTYKRKHVDWEIYAGLRESCNGTSGLIGILLPTYPLYNENKYIYENIPQRLADNIKSKYAKIYGWDYFIENNNFRTIIEDAFNSRVSEKDKVDNSRKQMERNLS